MNILVISNFYPPYYVGGYELACQDVVNGFRARGHDVTVLTSTYGMKRPMRHGHVYRCLYAHWHTDPILPNWKFALTQYHDITCLRRIIKSVHPDILHIWNMDRLGHPLLKNLTGKSGGYDDGRRIIPVVFAISDWWVFNQDIQNVTWRTFWERVPHNPFKRHLKSMFKTWGGKVVPVELLTPTIRHAHFFSRFLQQRYAEQGIVPESSRVIYHGVSCDQASDRARQESTPPMKLLYSGQILETKGVHTAIEALAILKQQRLLENLLLTIIGPQPLPEYMEHLHKFIVRHGFQNIVTIHEKVPRDRLEEVYTAHDVLLFPSIWEEPFSITILEAMAHGLVVIGTPTGGSKEILQNGENSLTFSAGNAYELANQIERIRCNLGLCQHIRTNAIATIQTKYSRDKMISEIEQYLLPLV